MVSKEINRFCELTVEINESNRCLAIDAKLGYNKKEHAFFRYHKDRIKQLVKLQKEFKTLFKLIYKSTK